MHVFCFFFFVCLFFFFVFLRTYIGPGRPDIVTYSECRVWARPDIVNAGSGGDQI
ncbi:unnamed protein product [Staurois parvus]|uniref:Uncharacterized protein n=1 Tax=Staurois parvus TaxID=386267 RepID=A0ABN9F8I6_9NEOB|nr:unnamed protein product [Staurois parvus]